MEFDTLKGSFGAIYNTTFNSAKGIYLFDNSGNKYIDCINGFGVEIMGHNHDKIKNAMLDFINADSIFQINDMFSDLRFDFMNKLISMLPVHLQSSYLILSTGGTGSDAVEGAIRLAKLNTKRSGMVALHGCYHGTTNGAISLTGKVTEKIDGMMPYVQHISTTLTPEQLWEMFDNDRRGFATPAGIILELTQSDGGIITLDKTFVQTLYDICQKYNIFFIVDEVQTGFGKTGTVFNFEQYGNIVPDAIVLSKALGGGMPIGCVLYKKKYTAGPRNNGTFRGNQIAYKLGCVIMDELKNGLLDNVNICSDIFKSNIQKSDIVKDVRIVGLLMGIEYVTTEICTNVFKLLLTHRLLVKQGGRDNKTLIFWIPLIITPEETITICNILNNINLNYN